MLREKILEALRSVVDPELGRDVVSLGMIKDLEVSDEGVVSLTFELTTPACPLRGELEEKVRDAVSSVPGVKKVEMKVTARVQSSLKETELETISGIKNVIAVASGKGGVGKSTVAVNLALALAKMNSKVGLLDADIYGPTIPKMLQVLNPAQPLSESLLSPSLSFLGVKVMSLGLMLPEDTPVIWRGPLVSKAIQQMLSEVDWGELDYLVVDLPPGTGDAPLTLAQTIPLTGVVIVTTPQDAALRIAIKALNMFRKLNVEILGIVENMSYFVCPHCGKRTDIFGHGGALKACKKLGVPFLGEIPLSVDIREHGDDGKPVVLVAPDSPSSRAFLEFAKKVAGRVSVVAAKKKEETKKKG